MPLDLRCPHCHFPLVKIVNKIMVCDNNHSFDIARQGYINLLPVQNKRTKEPGDSTEMIQSRHYFLNRGYYDLISTKINNIANIHLSQKTGTTNEILDAGCGEGFYINRLKKHFTVHGFVGKKYSYYGVDISKPGIKQATQYDRTINWIIASINDLPFFDSSLDMLLCIFTNPNFKEFSRILKKDGFIIFASPGPNHLVALRKIIYEKVFDHTVSDLLKPSDPYFELKDSIRVSYNVYLQNSKDIMSLLTMTPYYWNISPEIKFRIENLEGLPLEIDIHLNILSSKR